MNRDSASTTARRSARAERCVVDDELGRFERRFPAASTAVNPRPQHSSVAFSDSSISVLAALAAQSAAARPPRRTMSGKQQNFAAPALSGAALVERLTVAPFCGAAVHGERTVLDEAQQVELAVTWLRRCPTRTLQLLQQRVLCAAEGLFTQLVGMPLDARRVLETTEASQPAVTRKKKTGADGGEDEDVSGPTFVMPPQPLTFADFVGTYLRDSPSSGAGATAAAAGGGAPYHLVLDSGRAQPVAPLTSLHVPYGLHLVEDVLRRSPISASASTVHSATAMGLEDHQALLSQVVHWASFFETVFDNAREGLCRDPINLYVAILLACADRGAWELHNSVDALAEEAVQQLRLSDASSGRRPDVCAACHTTAALLAESCRSYVRHTLRAAGTTAQARRGGRGQTATGAPATRFFLSTAAVVWWAAAFLRLYRLRTPIAAPHRAPSAARRKSHASGLAEDVDALAAGDASMPADDVVSSAEAYFIRDWIAQAAVADKDGFLQQEDSGSMRVPLSCATHAPVAVFGFTAENVQAALTRMTACIDAAMAAGASIAVDTLLTTLQDDFAVVPYYLSFFSGM